MHHECAQCATPTAAGICSRHPAGPVLHRSEAASYEAFAQVLTHAGQVAVYLPWPIPADWQISDLGYAVDEAGRCVATVTTVTGPSADDGDVEISVISEEALVGLGARVAQLTHADPGPSMANSAPAMHVLIDGHHVPLWAVPEDDFVGGDVSVGADGGGAAFVGEWEARWLWFVVHPATAVLATNWALRDVRDIGPEALDLPFAAQ